VISGRHADPGGGGAPAWTSVDAVTSGVVNLMSLRSVRRRRQRLGLGHPERLEGRIALSTNAVAYIYTGAAQTWTVPAGVQSVGFNAVGGFGGGIGRPSVLANQLSGVRTIPSGATALEINVGGNGANQSTTGVGGWNGGGNGGWYENGGFHTAHT